MVMCAFSTTLPSPISPYISVSSRPSIQIPQQTTLSSSPSSSSPSSSTFKGCSSSSSTMVSEDSSTIAAIAEAVTLANAAAQAAKDAVSSALELGEITLLHTSHELNLEDKDGLSMFSDQTRTVLVGNRRKWKRKKKRRKHLGPSEANSPSSCFAGQHSSRSARSGYLTPREEAEFSLYLKEGAKLEAATKEICRTSKDDLAESEWPEAVEMEQRNVEEVLLKARECRERITLSYKRLVVSIATPYQGKGLSLDDLVQEGCIGLLRGAERFDCRRGYKLSTYVYWWIKQAVIKAIANKSRIVRLPGSMNGVATKVAEAKSLLRRKLGRWPTHKEIADLVDVSVSSVRLISERTRPPISVDQPVTKEGLTLKDIIPGPEETSPEAMVTRQIITQDLEKLLRTLNEREEYILRLYYGLNGVTARSCDEIGRLLNLSRERIRQIHCTALKKLQEKKSLIGNLID